MIKFDIFQNRKLFLSLIILILGFICIGSSFAVNIDNSNNILIDDNNYHISDDGNFNNLNNNYSSINPTLSNNEDSYFNSSFTNSSFSSSLNDSYSNFTNSSFSVSNSSSNFTNSSFSVVSNSSSNSTSDLDNSSDNSKFINILNNLTSNPNYNSKLKFYVGNQSFYDLNILVKLKLIEDVIKDNSVIILLNNYTNLLISNNYYDYNLTFYERFSKTIILERTCYFKNICSFDDLVTAFYIGNYTNKTSLIKIAYVHSPEDYRDAQKIANSKRKDVFKGVMNYVNSSSTIFGLNVIFDQCLELQDKNTWNISNNFDYVNIDANRSYFSIKNDPRKEYKFARVNENATLILSNIHIEGYNGAIWNEGNLLLTNVVFKGNKMDYNFNPDYGSAIQNMGYCDIYNVTFIDNYAKNGGAIFNQGYLFARGCKFINNTAYGEGNDIATVKGSIIDVDYCGNIHPVTVEPMKKWVKVLIRVGGAVISFSAGAVAGFVTANPVVGAAVGAAVGAGIGALESAIITSASYNLKDHRLRDLFIDMGINALAGGIGGYILGADAAAVGKIADPEVIPLNIENMAYVIDLERLVPYTHIIYI